MQALIHAHTDGTIVGVWVNGTPPDSAYLTTEQHFHERGTWLVGHYEAMPWDKRVTYIARRSPYVERWASIELADGLTAQEALRQVLDRQANRA